MPSSEFYRRQADTLLMLALIAADPELSARYRNMAVKYKRLATSTGDPDLARSKADSSD
jgi:hypothetical protein